MYPWGGIIQDTRAGDRLHLTHKLRLRRATRGSGEHRRLMWGTAKRLWSELAPVDSSTLAQAPASQL